MRDQTGTLIAALLIGCISAGGCAEFIGKRAGQGVAAGLKEEAANSEPQNQAVRLAGERAVAGALASLDEPEQRAHMRHVIDDAVRQAVSTAFATAMNPPRPAGADSPSGASSGSRAGAPSPAELLARELASAAAGAALREVSRALAPDGRLVSNLANVSTRVSASAVDAARERLEDLVPGCSGPDAAACRQRKLQELTRTAGKGFSTGVRDTIAWPALLAMAVLGCIAGGAGHRLWVTRRVKRRFRTA